MNRNKEFLKNTIILFLGKFTSQFMSLLLLPLFTHYLITEDYGTVDLFKTYISLFIPILTLRMDSAVFIYLIDNRKNEEGKKIVLSNVIYILFLGLLFALFLSSIAFIFVKYEYIEYVIIDLLVLMISNVLLQALRGIGNTKGYSIISVITGLITLVLDYLLIVKLGMGAESILIASIISHIVCITYCIISTKLLHYFRLKYVSKSEVKKLLKYSLPMIPNALSWWVVHVSDRTIISTFLGVLYNGIYAISCKFSNILNSIFTIINMSWQETVTLHLNDDDRDDFFSGMISKLTLFFGTISLLIIAFLPFVYDYVIGEGYLSSYEYIPLLLYSNLGNVFATLIGGIYVAMKKTNEVAKTTIISAIVNIVIDLILIQFVGLYAAVISTLISYIYLCIYRYNDVKKYVALKINFVPLFIYTIIFIIASVFYLINDFYLDIIVLVFVCIYSFFINRKNFKDILKLFFRKKVKNEQKS